VKAVDELEAERDDSATPRITNGKMVGEWTFERSEISCEPA
jgi:hypothetical protein